MKDRQIEKLGAWNIATANGKSGSVVAWAKMGPLTGTGPLDEPGEHVWFEFGMTREDAKGKLMAELGLMPMTSPSMPA